jgi:hypothetical protein
MKLITTESVVSIKPEPSSVTPIKPEGIVTIKPEPSSVAGIKPRI